MKRKFILSPTLRQIEHRLFGVTDSLIAAAKAGEIPERLATIVRQSKEWEFSASEIVDDAMPVTDETAIPAPAMPAYLQQLIGRKAAARRAGFSLPPKPGQIIEIRRIITPRTGQIDGVMLAPLSVLLDAPAEIPDVWHGWLMSGEADYAGWWDFVLQAEDQPFDPDSAMVQVWNPVRLYLPMMDRVTGELTPARLQAVRALAAEFATSAPPENVPTWPGRVAARVTLDDLAVTTGSPVRADDDPRRRYQQLYFHAAEAVREPARLALAESLPAAGVSDVLRQLIDAARTLGQTLIPVPHIAHAMAEGDSDETDLQWLDLARIRLLAFDDSTGEIEIQAIGEQTITCRLLQGGALHDKRTASPDGGPITIAWETGTAAQLTIQAKDGRELTLPLPE